MIRKYKCSENPPALRDSNNDDLISGTPRLDEYRTELARTPVSCLLTDCAMVSFLMRQESLGKPDLHIVRNEWCSILGIARHWCDTDPFGRFVSRTTKKA